MESMLANTQVLRYFVFGKSSFMYSYELAHVATHQQMHATKCKSLEPSQSLWPDDLVVDALSQSFHFLLQTSVRLHIAWPSFQEKIKTSPQLFPSISNYKMITPPRKPQNQSKQVRASQNRKTSAEKIKNEKQPRNRFGIILHIEHTQVWGNVCEPPSLNCSSRLCRQYFGPVKRVKMSVTTTLN